MDTERASASTGCGEVGLLVSVRSRAEAAAALAGGAAVIDVKDPARGPLGRADPAALRGVLDEVAGRRPVSAALGELVDGSPPPPTPGLGFVKWGLAGLGPGRGWEPRWFGAARELARQLPGCQPVLVAYADWRAASSPPVEAVVDLACRRRGGMLLIDTFTKWGRHTLLDWLGPECLAAVSGRCRDAGVRLALAGSLGPEEVRRLRPLRPAWIAVRGAACEGGREGAVTAERVRRLVTLLRVATPAG